MWRVVLGVAGLVMIIVSTCSREKLLFNYRSALSECTARVDADEDNLREVTKTSELCSRHLLHAACDDFCRQVRLPPQTVFLTSGGQLECQCGHER